MADTTNAKYCANCSCILLQPGEEAGGMPTARVMELLRQNHPPLDAELSAFRTTAEDTRATLDDLDSKIVQTRELLENLLSARQRAQSRLEDTKFLLHPMRSIPNELLTEIFHHCIPKTYRVADPDVIDPHGAPWLLTRVCHRWRELAVNTPQLWTYLLLDFVKHVGFITSRQCTYKVALFLERSRGLPMTVYLGSEESVMDHPVLPVLQVSIPRWRHLTVDLPRSSLQCLSGNSFLTLRTLALGDNDEEGWNVNVDVFRSTSAPVLRILEVCIGGPLEHVALPWSSLTSIVYFRVFDADDLKTLRTSTDLEDLNVNLDVWDIHTTPFPDIVSLPKLCRLTITEGFNGHGRSKEFLSALVVPALSELTLKFSRTSVIHLPTSPGPLGNLTKLDITCNMNSHAENTQHLLNFFTVTHHVESLCISDDAMTVEFVDGLNLDKLTDGSPARLPCLRFLDIGTFASAPCLSDDLDPLFEMLYSRLPTVMVEGGKGREETVDNAFCTAGRAGNGQNALSNETGMELSRLDSEDHRRCLKTIRFPRWLYVQTRREWSKTFLELTSRVDLL
ncbi:hypothetical protein BDZ89DRAFT_1117428 [Hymenopellis radicata]|nr:hypothetical protein BDZ89DRAFT_1117428 [Hymenopellis radicata]